MNNLSSGLAAGGIPRTRAIKKECKKSVPDSVCFLFLSDKVVNTVNGGQTWSGSS